MERCTIGRLVTLYDMLKGNDLHKVLIPKIQRDYAQGREEMGTLRKRFLNSIFDVVDRETADTLTLDFIFGQKEDKGKVTFFPVDGQQRLTTLFLFHMYVGKRAGEDTDFLKKFSYETRDSSRNFCIRLHEIPSEKYLNIKDYISDQWWYTGLWKNDPTIQSMINMLNDIDAHYRDLKYDRPQFETVWSQLIHNVNFWLLYLEDLGTTDELYIKMNSRGKPLTDFEHFKAMLDEYAGTQGELANKIDTTWTELLWRYRDASQDSDSDQYMKNGLDSCFCNLLRFYLNVEGVKRGIIDNPIDDIFELADEVLGSRKNLGRECAKAQGESARQEQLNSASEIMQRFSTILDFFSAMELNKYIHDPKTFFAEYISDQYDNWTVSPDDMSFPDDVKVYIDSIPDMDILYLICQSSGVELKPTLYAEAFFQYVCEYGKIAKDDFKDRLRILRNLVERRVRKDNFRANLLVVDELISNGKMEIPGLADDFAKTQKEQEKVKLDWMAAHGGDASLVKLVENHWLLVGNLYMIMRDDGSGKLTIDLPSLKNFGHLFNYDCGHQLVGRALLCYGDYAPKRSNGVKPYGGDEWTRWRDDIIGSEDGDTRKIIQSFLQQVSDYTESNLNSIIDKHLEDWDSKKSYPWQYYMVKYGSVRDARMAKFRYNGGNYAYEKLNANGGGRREKYWNPFNAALEEKLIERCNDCGVPPVTCELDNAGGPLYIAQWGVKIDIREKTVEIVYSDEKCESIDIPMNDGIDSVDRVKFAIDECDKRFSHVGDA